MLGPVRAGALLALPLLAGLVALAPVPSTQPAAHPGAAQTALAGARWGDDVTGEGVKASVGGAWNAAKDAGSLWSVAQANGAAAVWHKRDGLGRPVTGAGVTVALVDTGVVPVAGLDGGSVVNGPDLSFDSQDPAAAHLDGYGHGTHLAGIIAGRDAAAVPGREDDPALFVGMAPGARVLSVKVAAADGGTDVSQVIAGIDWVVAHRDDNAMNVRVLNLSYGTDSLQSPAVDPLARAVENAWRHGIVVVVAAGNDGLAAPRLTMPAIDPFVIAVGASDNRGTRTAGDDVVAPFTNGGSSTRRADVLAAGRSLVSLRDPGSLADREHAEGLVPGDRAARFFRGSGTSQAAAVTSGAVALLLQARPNLTPDQVKWLLARTAVPAAPSGSTAPSAQAGLLDVRRAVDLASGVPSGNGVVQTARPSSGLGSLEASRGSSHAVDPVTGARLSGEQDIFGTPWVPSRWVAAEDAGTAWDGGTWNTRRWSGAGWTGSSWASSTWAGAAWQGTSWSGTDWSTRRWSDVSWTTRRWSDGDWTTRRWSGSSWTTRRWSSDAWGVAAD